MSIGGYGSELERTVVSESCESTLHLDYFMGCTVDLSLWMYYVTNIFYMCPLLSSHLLSSLPCSTSLLSSPALLFSLFRKTKYLILLRCRSVAEKHLKFPFIYFLSQFYVVSFKVVLPSGEVMHCCGYFYEGQRGII